MAKVALNKAQLHKERSALSTYRRFLPSLDLKRRQLVVELAAARRAQARLEAEVQEVLTEIGRRLPMLAFRSIDLTGLVRVTGVELAEENRLGARLPRLEEVGFAVMEYGLLARPHWVDAVVEGLKRVAGLQLGIEVAKARVAAFQAALRKTTQRVNLFEQVLIPGAQTNIKRIEVFLADGERAAVVRSKLAKRKHALARAATVEAATR